MNFLFFDDKLIDILYETQRPRKFYDMENVLQAINRKVIRLSPEKVDHNKMILGLVLETFKNRMREVDLLFSAVFYDVFYGGSSYDGLKIGRPDEFDLDFLLDIGKVAEVTLELANVPGFMRLKMIKPKGRLSPEILKKLMTLCEGGYYNTSRILSWMASVTQKVFNRFDRSGAAAIFKTAVGTFRIFFRTSGPAVTLDLYTLGEDYYDQDPLQDDIFDRSKVMSIDLVPCFTFKGWPSSGFIKNPYCNSTDDEYLSLFFIVPQQPKGNFPHKTRYWRLSFQPQERRMICNKGKLKPAIRLLKHLRNRFADDQISSYYIKTVALHFINKKNDYFWDLSLTEVFMAVLEEYSRCISSGVIPFYWYPKHNLISHVSGATLKNIANRLNLMIKDIKHHQEDPERVAKYFLKPRTLRRFMED